MHTVRTYAALCTASPLNIISNSSFKIRIPRRIWFFVLFTFVTFVHNTEWIVSLGCVIAITGYHIGDCPLIFHVSLLLVRNRRITIRLHMERFLSNIC